MRGPRFAMLLMSGVVFLLPPVVLRFSRRIARLLCGVLST